MLSTCAQLSKEIKRSPEESKPLELLQVVSGVAPQHGVSCKPMGRLWSCAHISAQKH